MKNETSKSQRATVNSSGRRSALHFSSLRFAQGKLFILPPFAFDRRGQYALWTVGSLALFLVLIGLVIDMGVFLREFRRAQNAMSAGAQAAAQRIDPVTLSRTGQIVLLPDAHSVAQSYATLNAATTSVRVTSVELLPDHRVRARGVAGLRTPFFLSLFGFGSLRVNVSAVARPTFGAIRAGQ